MSVANILPVPIVQSGTGLVDFRIYNGGQGNLTDVRINVSGYLSTNGTISPTSTVRLGTMGPNTFTGVDASVTPNVQGIIKTNPALITFNPGGGDTTLNTPPHFIIAPSASPKVFWGHARAVETAQFSFALLSTSGNVNHTATGTLQRLTNTVPALNSGLFRTFPNVGVVGGFPIGDAWHPSDLPISLQFADRVSPGGRGDSISSGGLTISYGDQTNIASAFLGSFKYFNSGQQQGQVVTVNSGMYNDAYNDTYVFPNWESINVVSGTTINTTNLNALNAYVSGGGRVLIFDDAIGALANLCTYGPVAAGSEPTNIPFNFKAFFSTASGQNITETAFLPCGFPTALNAGFNMTAPELANMQNTNETIVARSGDALNSQLFKPYTIDTSESVQGVMGSFGSWYVHSGAIGTGSFKFGIQTGLSGYIIAGDTQWGSGFFFWLGAQGGSLVTTWALNALFMASKKWTNDTISGGYGPG